MILFQKCLYRNPQQRPDVSELLAQLKELGDLSEQLKALENELEEMGENTKMLEKTTETEQLDEEETVKMKEGEGEEEQEILPVNDPKEELAFPANFFFHLKNVGN